LGFVGDGLGEIPQAVLRLKFFLRERDAELVMHGAEQLDGVHAVERELAQRNIFRELPREAGHAKPQAAEDIEVNG
jgi:hypothetical protein